MNKPLVIYHASCADGQGAAFAAWLKLGDEAEYRACQYGREEFQDGETVAGREVYILDFSFDRKTMDWLFAEAKRVVWLDHHDSVFKTYGLPSDRPAYALDVLNATTSPHYIKLNNAKSGAYLAWEYFHPGTEVPMLIRHIDDHDRWQFKIDGTKAFNKALWSYAPWSFEQWKRDFLPAATGKQGLTFAQTAAYSALRKEGDAILRAHDANVASVVKGGARKCHIHDASVELGRDCQLIGLAANCPPHLTSDVGHELATQSGTFGLCWCLSQEGMIAKCSLRSNGDYDVSAIAKAFGGGGHRAASGFEVPIDVLLSWLK